MLIRFSPDRRPPEPGGGGSRGVVPFFGSSRKFRRCIVKNMKIHHFNLFIAQLSISFLIFNYGYFLFVETGAGSQNAWDKGRVVINPGFKS
jgi:hypothetical protein